MDLILGVHVLTGADLGPVEVEASTLAALNCTAAGVLRAERADKPVAVAVEAVVCGTVVDRAGPSI